MTARPDLIVPVLVRSFGRSTEKAVQVELMTGLESSTTAWLPKSVIDSEYEPDQDDADDIEKVLYVRAWKANEIDRELYQAGKPRLFRESHMCTGRWCHCNV